MYNVEPRVASLQPTSENYEKSVVSGDFQKKLWNFYFSIPVTLEQFQNDF